MKSLLRIAAILLCSLIAVGCGGDVEYVTGGSEAPSAGSESLDVPGKITEQITEEITTVNELANIEPANGSTVKIACIGDSITYGYGIADQKNDSYPAQLAAMLGEGYEVGNFGQSGSYALPADNQYNVKDAKLYYRNTTVYRNSLKFGADVVIIMLGTNDIRSMSCDGAKSALVAALKSLAEEYAALPTVKKVFVASCIYTPSVDVRTFSNGELARLIKQAAEEAHCTYIDVYGQTRSYMEVHHHQGTDRVHPLAEGATQIAKAVYAALTGQKAEIAEYPTADTDVVFVDGSAENGGDGKTPETAVNTLGKAVCLLRKKGGTVVVCGTYTVNYTCHMPDTEKQIRITSVYGGVDYRELNGARLGIKYSIYLYGDYVFDDITLCPEAKSLLLVCNYNDVTIGEGVNCTPVGNNSGNMLLVVGANIVFGGEPVDSYTLNDECNVTVNGGTWLYVRAGNRRNNSDSSFGGVGKNGRLTVTVNGGTFTNVGGNYMTAAIGMNSNLGLCRLVINGGTFNGPVYGVCYVGTCKNGEKAVMSGTVELEINGGTFGGNIIAQMDSTIDVTGEINIIYDAKYEGKLKGSFSNKIAK